MLAILITVLAVAAFVVAVVRLRGDRARRVSPPSQAEVMALISADKTVDAVRAYRRLTGLGLYEGKQAVDRIRASGVWEAPAPSAPPPGDDAVAALAAEGKIIEAISLYRETHGVDLTTAKDAVDKLSGR